MLTCNQSFSAWGWGKGHSGKMLQGFPLSPKDCGSGLTLSLKDGVLVDPAMGEDTWKEVVPKSLRAAVLEACHRSPGSGHFGISKPLSLPHQDYYWGQQRRDEEDFYLSCDACSTHK